jgi:hypothetical protein
VRSFLLRLPLAALVAAGVLLEGVLLYTAWPLGVLVGVAGGTAFTAVVGLRLQREWDGAAEGRRIEAAAAVPADEVRQPVAA